MTNQSKTILRAEDLSFSYNDESPTLKNISFSLNAGESLGVLGPNGGGKTTLMKIVAGLLRLKSGNLFINDINILDYKKYPYELFSYVPQNSDLNTTLPVKVYEYMQFTTSLFPEKMKNRSIDEILEIVGIHHKRNSLISKLSGGEKQRVLLARALINKPILMLLDEPTKGLDSNGQDQLLNLIENIKRIDQTSVMIVDHNINQIIRNCQKILCLNGSLHWHDHRDLLTKNILEDVYHCEFEHLLIHENDLFHETSINSQSDHHFCGHDHSTSPGSHHFVRGKK